MCLSVCYVDKNKSIYYAIHTFSFYFRIIIEEKSIYMGNEAPIIPIIRQVLLVTSPNDTPISELITTTLRASGVSVRLADTITLASQADEFAICIIILRPGQWRTTPVITTAMRSNPRCMIPVLAEPMALPAGAWSTEVLLLKEPLSETVHELELLINKQLLIAAKDTRKDQKPQTKNDFRQPKAPPTLRTINYNKARRRLSSISKYALIGFILVLLAGLLYYALGNHSPSVQAVNTQLTGSNRTISAFSQSDTVSAPGAGCNRNNSNWWQVGAYYKTLGTPTITAGKTPKETPTPHIVIDSATVAICQQHGLYLQHTNHYDAFSEIFFQDDAQQALPQHFSTQVTATALNPSSAATFVLGVRNQDTSASTDDSGYGDDTLEIGVDGSWRTLRINNVTDQEDITFTKGYIKPTHTMILGAEVDGPRITFLINGQKVTTIVDTTFPRGYAIGFGMSDSGAKSSPSSLYSNFSYQPLPDTTLTTQSAVATATVQANNNLHTAYTAAIPGPGCDRGLGQWQPVTKNDNDATASCQPHGLAISQDATAQYNGYASFYGLDGNLSTNYKVKVQIDTSHLGNGCAGLSTRTDTQSAAYSFTVCTDGHWQIQRYASNGGDGYLLAEGDVNAQRVYTLIATSNQNVQSLSLDGVIVSTVHDATLRTTDHIELTMYSGQNAAGTALFSNFVFTPLS
jgi:hypothetical protein